MSIDTLTDAGRRDDTGRATAGATLWFTGLPSAGKSTIAQALADRLAADGVPNQVLDGDAVRPRLSAGLGYTRADRDINVTRIGWVARLLASHGVVVLVPVIAPYAQARAAVRADHAENEVPFGEVFVSTSLEVAESRDVKGLYAKARSGEITALTGIDDPYEEPTTAELTIDTAVVPLEESVARAYALLTDLCRHPQLVEGPRAEPVECPSTGSGRVSTSSGRVSTGSGRVATGSGHVAARGRRLSGDPS